MEAFYEDDSSSFQWTPLTKPLTEMRLLKLQPGTVDHPIICDLEHIEFREAQGKYETLSYAWGIPMPKKPIFCSGARLDVGLNLFQALKTLRSLTSTRIMWIDAVCIDQGNLEERSQQVRRMDLIYSSAKFCYIWLGESEGFNPFASLDRWTNCCTQMCNGVRWGPADLDSLVDWENIGFMFSRPWFFRRWVVQEVILSRNVILMCGEYTSSWDLIQRLHEASMNTYVDAFQYDVMNRRLLINPLRPANIGFDNALSIAYCRATGHNQTLGNLLFNSANLSCSEPRDSVFALLNLVPEYAWDSLGNRSKTPFSTSAVSKLLPDYKLSLDVINTITARFLIETEGLHWLSWVPGIVHMCNTNKFVTLQRPTWSPSSFLNEIGRPDLDHLLSQEWSIFRAGTPKGMKHPWHMLERRSIDSNGELLWPFSFRLNGRILALQGRMITQVLHIGPSKTDDSTVSTPAEWLSSSTELCRGWLAEQPDVDSKIFRTAVCSEVIDPESGGNLSMLIEHLAGRIMNSSGIASYWGLASERCRNFATNRRICVTSNGMVGVVPLVAQVGDCICICLAMNVPLVIRPCGNGHYNLIGESFIDGLMSGQGWEENNPADESGQAGDMEIDGDWTRTLKIC